MILKSVFIPEIILNSSLKTNNSFLWYLIKQLKTKKPEKNEEHLEVIQRRIFKMIKRLRNKTPKSIIYWDYSSVTGQSLRGLVISTSVDQNSSLGSRDVHNWDSRVTAISTMPQWFLLHLSPLSPNFRNVNLVPFNTLKRVLHRTLILRPRQLVEFLPSKFLNW